GARLTNASGRRWVALGVGVSGIAFAIGGAALLGVVGARYDHCRALVNNGVPCASNEIRTDQAMDYSGKALLTVGVLALVGGTIGYVISARVDRKRHAWLTPTLGDARGRAP
ncbi:MAG: hypothetical protein ABI321_16175, partial [Polyangia bacterium]